MRATVCVMFCTLLLFGLARSQNTQFSERALLDSSPPGSHVGPSMEDIPKGFSSQQRLLTTYYFYWYDRNSGAHFRNGDGSDALTDHPANPDGYSYKNQAWHRRELLDVMDAGIDAILPVYWGSPADRAKGSDLYWSFEGIPPLAKAEEALIAEGKKPPKIGLFFDTSTLQHNSAHRHINLSTPDGKAWFYVTIRDFFSIVPPNLWATIDGRPMVYLYAAAFARAGSDDPALVEYLNAHFRQDFGTTPYLVREVSWKVPADREYAWGTAFGLKAMSVAAIGPGYDDHAVPGRTTPKQGRESGAFYRRNWDLLLAMDPVRRARIASIETWNELHEGTDICDTREYGRQYINITREYARMWKAGVRKPFSSPYAGARSVSITFGTNGRSDGIKLIGAADGKTRTEHAYLVAEPNGLSSSRYIYFNVDPGYYYDGNGRLEVSVEYFDEGVGSFGLEYDSSDAGAYMSGAYKPARSANLTGTGKWLTAVRPLADARFSGRQNSGADFRLATTLALKIRRVIVRKL